MMESIALTESHIVEEEDYVLVSLGSLDDDEESYDHCDDDSIVSNCDASTSSYSISISENFKNSTPHLGSLAEEATDVSVVSTEDSVDKSGERGTITVVIEGEGMNIKDPTFEEKPSDQMCEDKCEEDKKDFNDSKKEDSPKKTKKKALEKKEEPQRPKEGGSRLSNKKRRKKMKLMKKAEAAKKAQELLAEVQKKFSSDKTSQPSIITPGGQSPDYVKEKGTEVEHRCYMCNRINCTVPR
mmetsp:Transcript_4241/g.5772  ORF Transcript_4241/g.5772 Transcript_4241/m.5772 type:complete len:241 (-) Transcript_4241:354-1076(-)